MPNVWHHKPIDVYKIMTREAYTPESLDELALRLLDLCARVRGMAQRGRAQQLPELPLHDKKALEWIERLEQWAHKAETDLELRLIRERGARRAVEAGAGPRSECG